MRRPSQHAAARSALHKHIRRGEVEQAAGVARYLHELNDDDGLARRLTAIVTEDVEPYWLPVVAKEAVRAMTPDPAEEPADLVRVAATLAAAPKRKESYWLAETVWENRTPPREPAGFASLEAAVEHGDHAQVLAQLLWFHEQRKIREAEDLLRRRHVRSALAEDMLRWAVWRLQLGGFGGGEALAAAAVALVDAPEQARPFEQFDIDVEPLGPPYEWYCYDAHTQVGKIAVGSFAKRRGWNRDQLGMLSFYYESAVLGPSVVPGRWDGEAAELLARTYGWLTPEHGADLWAAIRVDFMGLVRWLLARGVG